MPEPSVSDFRRVAGNSFVFVSPLYGRRDDDSPVWLGTRPGPTGTFTTTRAGPRGCCAGARCAGARCAGSRCTAAAGSCRARPPRGSTAPRTRSRSCGHARCSSPSPSLGCSTATRAFTTTPPVFGDLAYGPCRRQLQRWLRRATDRAMDCWGGDGSDSSGDDFPAGAFSSVYCGSDSWHCCALDTDGAASCWGRDDYGQATPP